MKNNKKMALMLAAGLIFSGSGLTINTISAKLEKAHSECLSVETIGTVTSVNDDIMKIDISDNEYIVFVDNSELLPGDSVAVILEKIDKSLTSSNFENNPENYGITKLEYIEN